MLKVIVDATPITEKPSGVGLYVANLIRSLSLLQESQEFQLGIFYQPSLKNWLKKDFSYPQSLPNLSNNQEFRFFFPILSDCPIGCSTTILKYYPRY